VVLSLLQNNLVLAQGQQAKGKLLFNDLFNALEIHSVWISSEFHHRGGLEKRAAHRGVPD